MPAKKRAVAPLQNPVCEAANTLVSIARHPSIATAPSALLGTIEATDAHPCVGVFLPGIVPVAAQVECLPREYPRNPLAQKAPHYFEPATQEDEIEDPPVHSVAKLPSPPCSVKHQRGFASFGQCFELGFEHCLESDFDQRFEVRIEHCLEMDFDQRLELRFEASLEMNVGVGFEMCLIATVACRPVRY